LSELIFTVGHSTRSIGEFISLLDENRVRLLVDIRTIPRSRHNPQFERQSLEKSLRAAGLDYKHMPSLGGLRHARKDSRNLGWRNESFRGFADYMQTGEFNDALRELIAIAVETRLAVMCAEAVPWRCHRSLLADALSAGEIEVLHILGTGKVASHVMTSFARVEGSRVWYPPEMESLFQFLEPELTAARQC
jgi:uncharacterized protein (DUF488 family)